MAGITTFLDTSQLPARTQDQQTFDNAMAYVMQNFPKWGGEINATLAALNALAAGGAYAIPYKFSTTTTDADPGAGFLRLDNATQNAATTLRLDLAGMDAADYTGLIDTFDASTSMVKGQIRVAKQADPSKFLDFNVTARATATGYRNISVTPIASTSANPFANNDPVMLFFQRTGDKGDTGNGPYQLLAQATVSSAVANIDFLNVFSAAYDKYVIEVQGACPSAADSLFLRLAIAGAAVTTTTYYYGTADGGSVISDSAFRLCAGNNTAGQPTTVRIEISNANSTSQEKSIVVLGTYIGVSLTRYPVMRAGTGGGAGVLTGFRLYWAAAANFSSGTVRVFGIKNT